MRTSMIERIQKDLFGNKRVGIIISSLIVAFIFFTILLNIEKGMLADYETVSVVVAGKDIPEGIVITKDNYKQYLKVVEVNKKIAPTNLYTYEENILGKIFVNKVYQGTILTEAMVSDYNLMLSNMKEPVLAGFKAEEISNVVGGTLRAGDTIHIYVVDSNRKEVVTVFENVFVAQVFDATGTSIRNEDISSAVQTLNILIEKQNVKSFYSDLAKGTLKVVKEY